MKLEMCESLVYSWLRHVKGCHIVQTNWKKSSTWVLEGDKYTKLAQIMEESVTCFETEGYNLYKTNTLDQLLKQGEIDVVGIALGDITPTIYAIDVAFHEAGLNYGSGSDDTVARVIKKCIRTAMYLYAYMDRNEGDIIFASPKINPAVLKKLEPAIEKINELFTELGLGFKTRLIANADFNEIILDPVLLASGEIADTSELFLRSHQMCTMFAGKKASTTSVSPSNVTVNLTLSDKALQEFKIGKLVQTTVRDLADKNMLSEAEVKNLTDAAYSNNTFNSNIPVLKEIPADSLLSELKKDKNGYARYYASTISIGDKNYLLSSQWIEKTQRALYETWLSKNS